MKLPHNKTNVIFVTLIIFSLQFVFCTPSKELLHLDFEKKDTLGFEPNSLPLANVVSDAKAAIDFPGSLDLGTTGLVTVPNFKSPKGPFSIEARFRLNEYAPLNTRYISDILNTATWDLPSPHTNQGAVMRVGGGYLYTPLDTSSYANKADYSADIAWYDDSERASSSKCIGEFAMATPDVSKLWMEVVTNGCIMRNTWVHMVSVWDGERMHIYLDGQDATDSLRMKDNGAKPYFDSVATAYVGARTTGSFDSRHLNGVIDYVRVVDTAMKVLEIRSHYRESLSLPPSDTTCHSELEPEYPNPGQAISKQTEFRCKLVPHRSCTDSSYVPKLEESDSVEVEVSDDFEFKNTLVHTKIKHPHFKMADLDSLLSKDYKGAAYWRVHLLHQTVNKPLLKVAATQSKEWSSGRPLLVDLKASTTQLKSVPKAVRPELRLVGPNLVIPAKGNLKPILWSLRGVRSETALVRKTNFWVSSETKLKSSEVLILSWE